MWLAWLVLKIFTFHSCISKLPCRGLLRIAYSNRKYRTTYREKQGYYHWTLSHNMKKTNMHLFVQVAITATSIMWETVAFLKWYIGNENNKALPDLSVCIYWVRFVKFKHNLMYCKRAALSKISETEIGYS